jgi:hypothetical protein
MPAEGSTACLYALDSHDTAQALESRRRSVRVLEQAEVSFCHGTQVVLVQLDHTFTGCITSIWH